MFAIQKTLPRTLPRKCLLFTLAYIVIEEIECVTITSVLQLLAVFFFFRLDQRSPFTHTKVTQDKTIQQNQSLNNQNDFWNSLKHTELSLPAHAWKLWLLLLPILNTVLWRCEGKGAFHTFAQCSSWNNGQDKWRSGFYHSGRVFCFVLSCQNLYKRETHLDSLVLIILYHRVLNKLYP